MIPIIPVKRPKGQGWWQVHAPELSINKNGYDYEIWQHKEGFSVISAVEVAEEEKHSINVGPVYHISISKLHKRCTSNEAKWVCKQFDMQDAEEDNHVPGGFVRNFWRPIAEKYIGYECPCKETEPAIKEDKGDFIWRGFNK
jgi:hypothetical protein